MKLRYYLLTLAYCAGIFWLSSQPFQDRPDIIFPAFDKFVHMALYGGLTAVVSVGMRRSGKTHHAAVLFFVPIVFSALYGAADEIHQVFVPNRAFDPLDIVGNALGALLAQAGLFRWAWRIPLRELLPSRTDAL